MNKGVIYSVLAALAFSFQNVIVKDLSVSMGTGEIAFFRGTVSAVIIVALMKLQGKIGRASCRERVLRLV